MDLAAVFALVGIGVLQIDRRHVALRATAALLFVASLLVALIEYLP